MVAYLVTSLHLLKISIRVLEVASYIFAVLKISPSSPCFGTRYGINKYSSFLFSLWYYF